MIFSAVVAEFVECRAIQTKHDIWNRHHKDFCTARKDKPAPMMISKHKKFQEIVRISKKVLGNPRN